DDINIANGVCTVDFSSELLDDLPDNQQTQMLALYSIVNTLSQFDSVDYVRILVNGRALDSLAGVDVSTVIAPMYW
ncbi:MAG: GerMN domain-containing protein, partial [Clostridia bacterium]|nr:GerMN domain-containing protein [Clostridia bacterium]